MRRRAETALPRNFLLRSLPRRDLERLISLLEKVTLTPRRVLQHAGVPIEHVYFVEDGLVSVLASVDERSCVEVRLIGREGTVGSEAVLGVKISPLRHFVQIGGSALRISVPDLNRALAEMPAAARRAPHPFARRLDAELAIGGMQPEPFAGSAPVALAAHGARPQRQATSSRSRRICWRAASASGAPASRTPCSRSKAAASSPESAA